MTARGSPQCWSTARMSATVSAALYWRGSSGLSVWPWPRMSQEMIRQRSPSAARWPSHMRPVAE